MATGIGERLIVGNRALGPTNSWPPALVIIILGQKDSALSGSTTNQNDSCFPTKTIRGSQPRRFVLSNHNDSCFPTRTIRRSQPRRFVVPNQDHSLFPGRAVCRSRRRRRKNPCTQPPLSEKSGFSAAAVGKIRVPTIWPPR